MSHTRYVGTVSVHLEDDAEGLEGVENSDLVNELPTQNIISQAKDCN